MTKNKYLSLFFILLITFLASAIGGFTTTSFKEPWYSKIILPSFNPPSWVFAPVWTTLYIMMSVAIWKIWINSFDLKLLKLYFIHLFFNGTWSNCRKLKKEPNRVPFFNFLRAMTLKNYISIQVLG